MMHMADIHEDLPLFKEEHWKKMGWGGSRVVELGRWGAETLRCKSK